LWWLCIKMEGLPLHRQMFLLISSEHISAQIGNHQIILKVYINGGRVYMNYNAGIKF
jgi:hypothetical protein